MRLLPVLAISIASLTLVGCSTTTPEAIPTSSSVEQAPAFASDEEALAAAQAAYAEYLSVSDQIARDGGSNPERLKPLVSGDQYSQEINSFEAYSSGGLRSVGEMTFDTFHKAGQDQSDISFYLCLDSSQSRVFNELGEDVTPHERVDRWPMYVTFSINKSKLLVASSETWSGQNFC